MRVGHTKRAVSGFVMVLSWSRMLFVDFAFDQKLETFLRLHRYGLEYFGGTPKRVVYDNLKSVVLHHVCRTVQFNQNFLPFAGHYLFEPLAAPVRYPEFKGRVEHGVRYIRQSFYYGRSFRDLDDLRAQARSRLDDVANVRKHKSPHRRARVPVLRCPRCGLALPSLQSALPTRLDGRHHKPAIQRLGNPLPQCSGRERHRRQARAQRHIGEHQRQVPPLRS
jgi:hypothetical protein